MLRKNLVLALTLVALVGAATAQIATAAETPSASLTVQGTVVSKSPSSIDIEQASGNRMAFNLAPDVSLPLDLAVGSSVSVTYNELAGGQFQATRVAALDTAPAAVSTAPVTSEEPYTTTTADNQDDEALPRTASSLPLVAMLGLTLLVAAFALRPFRDRATQKR